MRTLFLGGAAALTLAVGMPALAQDMATQQPSATSPAMPAEVAMNAEQKAMYDGWTPENRASYDAWPAAAKSYYWTLTPQQVTGWWVLTDEQRVRIVNMTPDQRAQAWTAINAQLAGNAPPASGTASAEAGSDAMPSTTADTGTMADGTMSTNTMATNTMSTGNVQFVTREMVQPVQGSADAAALASGDLPVCTKGQQDGCINSYEKTGKGNRPLETWPGRPASEMPRNNPQG